jgi:Holliday junction DNA helicase RuvA
MYEYISGLVAELAPTYAVVDAAGVGYYINISLQTYAAIEGEKSARLYVHFIVREDAQQLYGFATKLERELFRNLISVSGVGGNTARMILSTYSTSELRNIIATENAVLLKNVKGLGLKTAQKIIVELSGKMLELGADKEAVVPAAASGVSNEIFDETMAALVMLGFQKTASEKVVKALLKESPTISVEEAVRQALRRL